MVMIEILLCALGIANNTFLRFVNLPRPLPRLLMLCGVRTKLNTSILGLCRMTMKASSDL